MTPAGQRAEQVSRGDVCPRSTSLSPNYFDLLGEAEEPEQLPEPRSVQRKAVQMVRDPAPPPRGRPSQRSAQGPRKRSPPAPRESNQRLLTSVARGTSSHSGSTELQEHHSRRDPPWTTGRSTIHVCGSMTQLVAAEKNASRISLNSSLTLRKPVAPRPPPREEAGSTKNLPRSLVPCRLVTPRRTAVEEIPQEINPTNPREAPGEGRTALGTPET